MSACNLHGTQKKQTLFMREGTLHNRQGQEKKGSGSLVRMGGIRQEALNEKGTGKRIHKRGGTGKSQPKRYRVRGGICDKVDWGRWLLGNKENELFWCGGEVRTQKTGR